MNEKKDVEIFDFLTKMYAEMQNGFSKINEELQEVKTEVRKNSNNIIRLENKIDEKLSALFDGYTQNAKLLEDIQDEVAKHEEVILKRIK